MQYPITLSFFTVVMNRLHHLSQTLPVNLGNNACEGIGFTVLDYGSTDRVSEYISDTFPYELKNGRLKFYSYKGAKYFNRCHSRNLAARLSDSDIVCNIDADNFTGREFDSYLLSLFGNQRQILVTGLGNPLGKVDAFGRLAVRRKNFMDSGGYDESFEGYGFEDYDLVERLGSFGIAAHVIAEEQFLQTISHAKEESVVNEWLPSNLEGVYSQQVNASMKVLMYLYKNKTLHYGLVTDNGDHPGYSQYRYSLAGRAWQNGTWHEHGNMVKVSFADFNCFFKVEGEDRKVLTGNNQILKKISDRQQIKEAILFNTEIANRYRMLENKEKKISRVNNSRGIASVEEIYHRRTLIL